MGKALYRKYRSKSLDEVIGQDHITKTLDTAIKNGAISHAYLFTGPRGVGKTSVARILAHKINDLAYKDDSEHLDIIEIDAASNRRIDEIRELKSRVHIAPTQAKYKVYIIDEVHMLTKEAFNALLKTLEEPPAHAIFMLATTEAHKLPETIVSRTQRFGFRPIALNHLKQQLEAIAAKEGINIDDEALELVAVHGDGSFRDSISLLDQIQHTSKDIKVANVIEALGMANKEVVGDILDCVSKGDFKHLNESLQTVRESGVQPTQLAKQMSERLRDDLLGDQATLPKVELIKLLNDLARLPSHPNPSLALELILIDKAMRGELSKDAPNHTQKARSKASDSTMPQQAKPNPKPSPTKTDGAVLMDENSWPDVLKALKTKHNTLYGIVRMANPRFSKDNLILEFTFPFHHKKLKEDKNQKILSDVILAVTAKTISIVPKLTTTPLSKEATASDKTVENDDLASISNIFGSAEVIES